MTSSTSSEFHRVIVRTTEVDCACGYREINTKEGEVLRLAYIHARRNTPSIVQDFRTCMEECNGPEWHHPECDHYNRNNEDIHV